MPGASTPAAKLASIQAALTEIKSVAAQLSSIGEVGPAGVLLNAAAGILQAAEGLEQDATAASSGNGYIPGGTPPINPGEVVKTGTTPTPTTPEATQTYVSAPAVGAIALIALVVGGAGGYVTKGFLDKKKRKLVAREEAQLTEGEEE